MIDWLDQVLAGNLPAEPPDMPPRLAALCEALGAGAPADRAVLALALAPDLDPAYARAFAALQAPSKDNRPEPSLVRALFGPPGAAAIERLAAAGLVAVGAVVEPDPHAVALATGSGALHPRLRDWARILDGADDAPGLPCDPAAIAAAAAAGPVRIWLAGARPQRAEAAARAIAARLGSRALAIDLGAALVAEPDLRATASVLVREAWLHDAVLCLIGGDRLFDADEAAIRSLARALSADGGVTVIQGDAASPPGLLDWADRPLGIATIAAAPTGVEDRDAAWRGALAGLGMRFGAAPRRRLAARFRLDADEIAGAARIAMTRLLLGQDRDPESALRAAARGMRGHRLAAVATWVEPRARLDDLLLPPDTRAQLEELIDLVTQRERVWNGGGFGRTTARGSGVSALFAGASGTGKTTAAEAIAAELGLDLYRIDLARIVSKYIGETEKNLDRVFEAAEGANAVLLFDEADAIFGKRSEVQDAHDRYANVEVAYLLQRVERYDGVALLTSNLRHHLDEGFLRRLTVTITFPIPDEAVRRRLWAGAWPAATAVEADVDRGALAARYRLSGGGVRNVALYAAHLAAAEEEPVRPAHVARAIRREYAKLGVAVEEATA